MKTYRLAWSISLLVIACITIISVVCSFAGIKLPDAIIRVFGLLDLCSLVVLAFTTVKLQIWKKKEKQELLSVPEQLRKIDP